MPAEVKPFTEPWDESQWVLVKRVWAKGKMWPFQQTAACQAIFLSKYGNRVVRKYALKLFEQIIPFSYLEPEISVVVNMDGKEHRIQASLARMMWVNADEHVETITGSIVPKDGNVNDWRLENLDDVKINTKYKTVYTFIEEDLKLMREAGFDPNGSPQGFDNEVLDRFPQRLCEVFKQMRKVANARSKTKDNVESKPKHVAKRARVSLKDLHDIHDVDYITVSRIQIGSIVQDYIGTDDFAKVLLSKSGKDILAKKRDGEFTRLEPIKNDQLRLCISIPVYNAMQKSMFNELVDLLWLVWLNAHPEIALIDKIVYPKNKDDTNWSLDNLEYLSRAEIAVKTGTTQPVVLVDYKDESEHVFLTRAEAAAFLVRQGLVNDYDKAIGAIHEAFCGKRDMLYRRYCLKPATTKNETRD